MVSALQGGVYSQPFAVEAMRDPAVLEALLAGDDINGLPSSPFLGTQVVGGEYYQSYFYAISRMSGAMTEETIQVSQNHK